MKKILSKLKMKEKHLLYLLFLFIFAGIIIFSWQEKEEVKKVTGKVYNPSISRVSENRIIPDTMNIVFSESVADLDLIGKKIEKGIDVFPEKRGVWVWENGKSLTFYPEKDWHPDVKYTVKLKKDIFSPAAKLEKYTYEFTTPKFEGDLVNLELYEDVRNPKIKKITGVFKFSHPVDVNSLKTDFSIDSDDGRTYGFELVPDETGLTVHLVSEPVQIKTEENFVELNTKNTRNVYNDKKLAYVISRGFQVPSSSTFFKLNNVRTRIIKNNEKDNKAEQVLFLDFSSGVSQKDLGRYINIYKYKKGDGVYCDKEGLKKATLVPLDYTALPTEHTFSKNHAFVYDIEKASDYCVVVDLEKGLSSQDDFMMDKDIITVLNPPRYPAMIEIGFDGSLISLTGKKNLSLVSYGVDEFKYKVSRINTNQINHLITQTSGDFSNPRFNHYFSEDNIAENFSEELPISMKHPADINYSSLDLEKYFENKKGVFLVEVTGYRNNSYINTDRRLVVVTDMGIIEKVGLDYSKTLFVSNFKTEQPVRGASVKVLGKNGLPILEAVTDSNGMVEFPNFDGFEKEKTPVVYVVSTKNDFSYIPVGEYDRKLDYSRFDVEGEYSDYSDLKAMMFTDRGIYRPSENVYIGAIIRDKNLSIPKGNNLKFSIYDVQGKKIYTKESSVEDYGLLDYEYKIDTTAKTGRYYAQLEVKKKNYYENIGSIDFRVEEFVPETLKITTEFADAKKEGWINKDKLSVLVSLDNLYGNPAIEHVVEADFTLQPATFHFRKFKDYNFSSFRDKSFSQMHSVSESIKSAKTNKDGEAEFIIDLNKYVQGTYNITFHAKGLEKEGGRSVFAVASAFVSPEKHIVGYKTDGSLGYISREAKRHVDFIAVNPDLEKIELANLKLQTVEKKYVSSLVQQANGTYKYQSVAKEETIKEQDFIINAVESKIALDTTKAGDFYLRLVDEENRELVKVAYSIAGKGNISYELNQNAELQLKLHNNQYDNGDLIKMQITAPYTGYGLITIERDKVYAYKWFKMDTLSTEQSIRLPDGVEGNAYVNVAFVRNKNSKEIFMSPFSYAVKPFEINKAERTLKIDVGVPEVVKPGEVLNISYKTSSESQIILYGVNEGILQFAKYQTPDLLDYFFIKKALRVSTFQILDLILPDAELVKIVKAAGGDMFDEEMSIIAKNLNPFARKVDKPVVFWSGVLNADKESQNYTYVVPTNFNGKIRVMAVGVNNSRFGSTQDDVFVRGDFALTPSAPFNVAPGDEFDVGLSVANMVEESLELPVTLKLITSENLEVIGDSEKTFQLKEKDETSFNFKVKAKDVLGNATIMFEVVSKPYSAKMTSTLSIRPAVPYSTDLNVGMADKKLVLKDFIIPMYDEFKTSEIMASTSPMVIAQGLVKYLDKYPYGCTEQMVSRAFPLLAILYQNPELLKDVDVYDVYNQAISILQQRQAINGGFTTWNYGGSSVRDFNSIYATHFLLYAKEHDFDVPASMLRNALSYMKEVAGKTPSNKDDAINISYAIYVLTLGGEVTTNYIVNLEKNINKDIKNWEETLAASYMAATYDMLQNKAKASEILGEYIFGKNSINDFRHIYLMALYFPNEFEDIKEKSLDMLLKPLKEGNFNSLSSAYSVLALNAYPYNKDDDKNIKFSLGTTEYDNFAKVDIASLYPNADMEITSSGSFFYVVNQQGFKKDLPEKSVSEGIEVAKDILDEDGKEITSAKIGQEVTVRLRVRSQNQKYIEDVVLVDLTSGSFEVDASSISINEGYFDNVEPREDRVLIYLSAGRELKEITYKAKVIAKGEFIMPPVYGFALYDADIKANTKVEIFTVNE